MRLISVLAAGVCAAGVIAAAPAKAPQAASAPVANYWMDVATTSGMGAGMSAAQMMQMMSGGGSAVMHSLDLRLASKQKAEPGPKASAIHWIPAGLQMGPSLPLVTPVREEAPRAAPGSLPANYQPKGRMLIYWGCGEHAGAGQPTVIDFAKVAAGKLPPGMAGLASMAKVVTGPHSAPGFGRWPNERDSRAVPAAGSLLGAHKVQADYAPQIDFSLAAGQDFMPGLALREAGALPSGAARLAWTPAPTATGYALAMFGSNPAGDVIMWSSSAKAATMPHLDYLAPAEVKRLVAAGAAVPPTTGQCLLPAEVASASPAGMVTMIGYGPELNFAESPKAPKWTAKVRFKTTASLMRGMGGAMDASGAGEAIPAAQQPQQQPPKKKKRGFGLGDLIQGATGVPVPQD